LCRCIAAANLAAAVLAAVLLALGLAGAVAAVERRDIGT
jgi:hypothetical protein